MTTLTVTAKGQVTLKHEVLRHLGVRPGEKLEVDLLPEGKAVIQANHRAGSIHDFIGLFTGQAPRVFTTDEINAATAAGWAGESE
jgi:bifunctional DNA-binding transcriptional regulator/antitoxin component of YhaV-PrlF toxin-antitoxin module